MNQRIYDTIIIGAGISGLACARRLQEYNKEFLVISKNIGGRILTSDDGNINYGAYFVCSDYNNILNFVKLKKRIKLTDFCFHENDKIYTLIEPEIIFYLLQFIKFKKDHYKFRRELRKFREITKSISQKSAIETNPFLHELYMKNALDYVKENNIEKVTDKYFSKGLYSTTFSNINEMNAFSFLQFLLPLITPIYTFIFDKENFIKTFKDQILQKCVYDILFKNDIYKIKTKNKIYYSNKIVLATPITWSKKFANVYKINKPVNTNMLHISGKLKDNYSKKEYQLFNPLNEVQAIADLKDGTYLFYYRDNRPSLNSYFKKFEIISHHLWNPAGTINGHNLIESYRGNNMYLIGDYNIAGLEESYITGLFAANQIIKNF
jgi:hypothetical protein